MNGFLDPEKVLKQLKIEEDMIAADFGSGSGGWVLPLAKQLEDGKVYAIDILEEPLSALKSRANLEKLTNIETVQSDIEKERGSGLMDFSCDLVLMSNLLFQVDDKEAAIKEGKRVLKEDGNILIVDWKNEAPRGPDKGRVSEKEVKEIAKRLGLKLEKEFEAGDYHYGLLFKK